MSIKAIICSEEVFEHIKKLPSFTTDIPSRYFEYKLDGMYGELGIIKTIFLKDNECLYAPEHQTPQEQCFNMLRERLKEQFDENLKELAEKRIETCKHTRGTITFEVPKYERRFQMGSTIPFTR